MATVSFQWLSGVDCGAIEPHPRPYCHQFNWFNYFKNVSLVKDIGLKNMENVDSVVAKEVEILMEN